MKSSVSLITFLLLVPFVVNAQDAPNKTDAAGKKQGHWIKYDDKHKKLYDGNFVDNVPVGKFIYYYDTGTPWAVTMFSDNGKVARTKTYDAGGKITGEGKYVNEKKDSTWKFYNEEGGVLSIDLYSSGAKNGICKVFYHNGDVAEEKLWKDGVPNGIWKKYFQGGAIKYNGQTIKDKVEGKVTFYYPTGQIQAEGIYKGDLKDGDWKYYTEDGKIKRIDKFINGVDQNPDRDVIKKEKLEKDKREHEGFEIKNPYEEGYTPR